MSAPSSRRGRFQSRRARLFLALGGGILALLCLGGVGIFVALYDDATKIDRSEPDIVADSFLIGFLVERNDEQAQLFTCESPNLEAVRELRDGIVKREADYGVTVTVSWGALYRQATGEGRESVSTELTISSYSDGKFVSGSNEGWVLEVLDQDGSWRVCGAQKEL